MPICLFFAQLCGNVPLTLVPIMQTTNFSLPNIEMRITNFSYEPQQISQKHLVSIPWLESVYHVMLLSDGAEDSFAIRLSKMLFSNKK
jgi:hypothetical protein